MLDRTYNDRDRRKGKVDERKGSQTGTMGDGSEAEGL